MVQFPSTVWHVIKSAGGGDRGALEDIFRKYQPAVVRFAQAEGCTLSDAEDVAQEVFQAICDQSFLKRVDPSKGKFRSLVLAITKNLVLLQKRDRAALKRGGGSKILSVEELRAQGFDVTGARDERFDNFWVQGLLARAMDLLKRECQEKGTPFYRAMALHVSGEQYSEISDKLNAQASQVKSYIHQARGKLKRYVAQLIKEYSGSDQEYRAELRYLLKYLK
jgi:RNA polymerase sigma factor (sigma-70 family)